MSDTEIFDQDRESFLIEMEADIAAFMADLRTHGFKLPAYDNRESADDLAA